MTRDDRPEQRLSKLEALLARSALDVDAAMPLIAALLSIPTGDRYPLLAMTPQRRKDETLQTLLTQLAGLAAREPVLMMFEDAHWIDPTSIELLGLAIERCGACRSSWLLPSGLSLSRRGPDSRMSHRYCLSA